MLTRQSENRFVASRIERTDGYRAAGCPLRDRTVYAVLLFFIGQALMRVKQELGTHQPDAVYMRWIDCTQLVGLSDVDHHTHTLSTCRVRIGIHMQCIRAHLCRLLCASFVEFLS